MQSPHEVVLQPIVPGISQQVRDAFRVAHKHRLWKAVMMMEQGEEQVAAHLADVGDERGIDEQLEGSLGAWGHACTF